MNREEFINSKIKLSKEDIIEDYYKTEEKLIKTIGVEHKNYELQQENKQLHKLEILNRKLHKTLGKSQLAVSRLLKERDKLEKQVKKQREVTSKAIDFINSNPNVFYDEHLIDVETLKNNEMTDEYVGDIRFISTLLDILKGDSNE